MTSEIQGDGSQKHRFLVDFSVEGSIEIEVPGTASDAQITKAARNEIWKEFSKSRGCPWEIQIGMVDGPF